MKPEYYDSSPYTVTLEDDSSIYFEPLPQLHNLGITAVPFLLLKPTALVHIGKTRKIIESQGFVIQEEYDIHDYLHCTRYLHPADPNDLNSFIWLMVMKSYLTNHPDRAHAFMLDKEHLENHQLVDICKKTIRETLGELQVQALFRGKLIATSITPVHAPNYDKVGFEHNVLMNFINNE